MKVILILLVLNSLAMSDNRPNLQDRAFLLTYPQQNKFALADPIPTGFVEILRYTFNGHDCVVFRKSVGNVNRYRHYSDGRFEKETVETMRTIWPKQ